MTDLSDLVVGMIALNKKAIAGKTRLQKSFFLLDKCGVTSGVDFDYYNFGPFSFDVATAVDDAVASKRLNAEEKPGYYAVPYTLYSTNEDAPVALGNMRASDATVKLSMMERYSALAMEIAATIIFLRDEGYNPKEAVDETKRRKPVKATDERVARAHQLIEELGL